MNSGKQIKLNGAPVIILFIISAVIFFSCAHNTKKGEEFRLTIKVRDSINIDVREAEDIFQRLINPSPGGKRLVEITIYSYSSGKETFYYSRDSEDTIETKTLKGTMSAILKIKEDGRLVDVIFLDAEGKTKGDLIEKIAAGAKKVLR